MDADISNDFNTITFKNSLYTCTSVSRRISGDPRKYDNAIIIDSVSNNNVVNSNTNIHDNKINTMKIRDNFIGIWNADGSCHPSSNCCCLVDSILVTTPEQAQSLQNFVPPENPAHMKNPNALYARGKLDGGVACFRKTYMDGICVIESNHHGSCVLQGITFNATLHDDNRLVISNSVYKNCESVVYKSLAAGLTVITIAFSSMVLVFFTLFLL